jgi:hypothetical protein
MIRQDYLLNLIEQLGKFLRQAIAGESVNSDIELNQTLEQLTDEILGLPVSLITSLQPEELIHLFELSDRMVVEKCYLTAEINRLKAIVEKDSDEKERLQERAVFFFDLILPQLSGKIAEEAHKHLSELKQV